MSVSSKFYACAKWVVLILAYGFLAYKLITFDDYATFFEGLRSIQLSQFVWLLLAVVLWHVNLWLESEKWRLLVAKLTPIPLTAALKSLLIGHTGGFATPNRLGEYPMRVMCFPSQVRLSAVAMGFVGSFIQNFIITVCGLVALCFFRQNFEFSVAFFSLCLTVAVISFVVFFFLPDSAAFILRKKQQARFADFWRSVSSFSRFQILEIVAVAFLRYVVFSFQFYLMLRFCGVSLSLFAACISIPIVYLCVTYTPSIAFSEAVVRSSYAILIIGCYSSNLVGIALAGILIWILNSALPMIIGSFLLRRV